LTKPEYLVCQTELSDFTSLILLEVPTIALSYTKAKKLRVYVRMVPHPVASLRFPSKMVIIGKNQALIVLSLMAQGPNLVVKRSSIPTSSHPKSTFLLHS
jgi:hypothetical protein